MKKPVTLLCLMLLALASFAQEDVTSKYIQNADFSKDTPLQQGVTTYDYDMSTNGVTLYGQQPVTDWNSVYPSSNARSAGIFELGKQYVGDYTSLASDASTPIFLGGTSYITPAPTTGITSGNVLGMVAVWTNTVQYTQDATLPAGIYTLTFSVYNSGGTTAVAKNLFGFIGSDNSEHLASATTYTDGSWTTETVTFTLTTETSGYFSLGYKAANAGSGSMPHLYVANIKLSRYEYYDTNDTYYLYNTDGKGWVREGSSWGTKASLKPYGGTAFTLVSLNQGYKFTTPIYSTNQCLGINCYLDNWDAAEWDVSKLPDGSYSLYNPSVNYLKHTGMGNGLATTATFEDAAKWRVISKTERTASLADATADTPMDATYFITNPDFSQGLGTKGWSVTTNGGEPRTGGDNDTPTYSNYNWQQWNGTFSMSQSLTGLPEGVYELKVQGFYRPGSNNTQSTDQNATIYAGDYFRAPLVLIADGGRASQDNENGFTTSNSNNGSANSVYVPDSQIDARNAFESSPYGNETYDNSLKFVVGADGNITIGAEKTTEVYHDWTVVDNFRLFFLGTTLTDELIDAVPLPTGQMNSDVKQTMMDALATAKSTHSIADYDNLLSKIEAAKASIEVYKKINDTFLVYLNTANQRGDIPEAYVKASGVYTHYSDGAYNSSDGTTGTYVTADEVVTAWRAMASAYWAANEPEADDDMTAFIVNQGFEMDHAIVDLPTGWTVVYRGSDRGTKSAASDSYYQMTNSEGSYLFNNWDASSTKRDLTQQLTGLPAGTYKIDVVVAGKGNTIHLRGNGSESTIATGLTGVADDDAATGLAMSLEAYVTDNGVLDLQVYVDNRNTTGVESFFKADNFRLTYVSKEVSQEVINNISLPTDQMNSDIRKAMVEAKAALTANPTNANYLATLSAIQDAEASIAEYVKIKTYLDNLNTTNQRGDIPADTYLSYAVGMNYSNGAYPGDGTTGTYKALSEVLPLYREFVSQYWTANKDANKDMTAFIVNQGFEFGAGSRNAGEWPGWENPWNYNENDVRLMTGDEGTWCANMWSTDASRYKTMTLSQALTGLPNGTYELTARLTSYANYNLTLTGGQESEVVTIAAEGTFQTATLQCLVGADGKMTIKVSHTMESGKTFLKADNFRLTYKSDEVLFTLPDKETGDMKKSVKDAQDAAYDAFDASKTAENYHAALTAYNDAVESVAAYAKAKATIGKVTNLLKNTNVYTYDAYKTFYTEYKKYLDQYTNRTMENYLASTIEYNIFGNRSWHQTNIMVVPFLGSAWDDAGDYKWQAGDYWINTWSTEGDSDGSDFVVPFMEYFSNSALAAKTLTATVLGTTGKVYTVTADIRLKTTDGNAPTGVSMQIGNGTAVDITGTQIGSSAYYLTTGATASGAAANDSIKIKLIIADGTNVSWVAFQHVWVDYSGEAVNTSDLDDAIKNASSKKLGFISGEYSPYTNVDILKTLETAKILQSLGTSAPPALVNAAIAALNGAQWTVNTDDEMNAIYWTSDYTADQVYKVTFYTTDGAEQGSFNCLDPSGWDFDGRADAYNTRIQKYGVNASDVGLRAIDDETGLFVKYNTNYGQETGYTMPLEPNTKYSLSFIYSCWGENKDIKSNFRIYNKTKGTYVELTEEGGFKGYTNNNFTETGKQGDKDWFIRVNKDAKGNLGNSTARNWDIFRGFFTTTEISDVDDPNDEYELIIEKDRDFAHNTLGYQGYLTEQYQIMLGDLYILRYKEDNVFLNGDAKDTSNPFKFTKDIKGSNIELKRTITSNRWNTLVLPFKLIWREANQLLDVEKLYYYKGTSYSGHYAILNFEGLDVGLRADVPVLIRYENEGGSSKVISGDEANGGLLFKNYITCAESPVVEDPNNLFDFTGTYDLVQIPQWAVYVKYNNDTKESELIQRTIAPGNSWMQPTRAYFTIDPSVPNPSEVKLMSFTVDDIETGIMAIDPDGAMTVTSGNIYDLNGRLVRSDAKNLEGLPRGIYVVDGRKVAIR